MPELYNYQKKAVADLLDGKRIALMGVGTGKTAVMFKWLQATGKKKVVIVTTASKVKSKDMERDALTWCGEEWVKSLSDFTIISWHKLNGLVYGAKGLPRNLSEYAFAFDEIQKSKGFITGMGKSFRWICDHCDTWTGYTATPGDQWKDYLSYFTACGLIKNKTEFMRRYCIIQTFRGFTEIIGYENQDELSPMWRSISTTPDTSEMMRELPEATHEVVEFKAPRDYKRIIKERVRLDTGELIESTPELCHHLRQVCFTKDKQEWLSDFIENLGTNCIFFCNYIEEEDKLCELAAKALPKGAKVWRIDGKHHDIPTKETIGKYDIVVAHYLSGGEALNFQFMNYWVSVSPHYSYSTSEQARGRIKRIGQTMPMFFYYLWAKNTIEDDIYACLKSKSQFSEKIWAVQNGIDLNDQA